MCRLRAISAFLKHGMLGLVVLACSSVYGGGLQPLGDASTILYPFNTVCKVTVAGETEASGVLVSENLILTYAGAFAELFNGNAAIQDLGVQVRVVSDGALSIHSVNKYFLLDGYQTEATSGGITSNAALEKSLLLLVLSDAVDDVQPAIVNTNYLQEDSYRMIVGFAGDLYSGSNSSADQLHATGGGEAVYAQFGQVNGRLYHSGDLKASAEALGSPVFSYYDGIWSVDGILVETDVVEGACKVAAIDASFFDVLTEVLGATGGSLSEPDSVSGVQDANLNPDSAASMDMGSGKIFTIAPEGDVDYLKLSVSKAGDYLIESFGDLDVNGTLYNSALQQIIYDDDSSGSLNFQMNVNLKAGNYYLLTKPNSSQVSGLYGISLLDASASYSEYSDTGFSSASLIPLSVDSDATAYRLSSSGEVDSFRLTVTSPGHFILKSTGDLDLKAAVFTAVSGAIAPYDSSEIVSVWDSNDDFTGLVGNVVLDAFLDVGEYVVAVEARNAGEFGPYQLTTSFYSESLPIVDTDDGSGSFATATVWTPGVTVKSTFDAAGDRDSYKFELESTSELSISISCETDVAWFLYDEDLNQVDTSGVAVVDPVIQKTLSGGTYYLVMAAMTVAPYTIH